jgi:N-acetylgalactosamine kinase
VNLIGEHIDYSGYAVLPFALEQDVVVALKVDANKPGMRLANMDPKFQIREIAKNGVNFDKSKHDWSNYFLAAYKGIMENNHITDTLDMSLVVHGTVVMGSGLSSSSACVCAFALAVARAHKLEISKTDLANITCRCERYIGLEGGGMDQAISFLAQAGTAKLIEFNPLRNFDVTLPQGATFVISNSLVESTKYVTAATNYNMRVLECKLSAAVLAKKMGVEWQKIKKLKDLQETSGKSLQEMVQEVETHLHKGPYSKQEIGQLLEMDEATIDATYMATGVKVSATSFELYKRSKHVYSESLRVYNFRDVAAAAPYPNQLQDLGKLMNESHFSCSADYECSCDELDALTKLCREAGAFGSRLTGAGWGGCVISLIPSNIESSFVKALQDGYYHVIPATKALSVSEYIFSTKPGAGAAIFQP